MRQRLTWLASAASMALALGSAGPGLAQPAPGPGAAPPLAPSDPPARVGRIARISGTVSFHTAGAEQWQPATLNYPVTTGDALWTEPGASTEVDVDNSHLTAAGRTELDVDTLNEQTMALTVPQGETYLRIPDLAPGETVTVRTPRGIVTIQHAGSYDVAAGDTEHPTLVTVIDGAVQVSSEGMAPLDVGPHQTATLTGTDTFTGRVGPEVEDAFLRAELGVSVPAPVAAVAPIAPQLAYMTGADVLETTGEWEASPDYGPVWYPPVAPDWAPYQDGAWDYVGTWGWTWVDAEPWGFAPFHYGRWARFGSRWGWVPDSGDHGPDHGPDDGHWGRPVYAPALVRWVDVGARRAGAERTVGWIPLGPHERYQPWYRTSPAYVRDVNRSNVTNVAGVSKFANRQGLMVASVADVTASRNVRPHEPRDAAALLASARPLSVGIHPTAATVGVSPAVAHHVRVDPAPAGFTPRPAAPGPVIQAHLGSAATGHVALRPPESGAAPASIERTTGQQPEPGHGPEHAGTGPNGAAVGAIVGGAAAVGGAALLNHAHPPGPGQTALPALATPHGAGPSAPGAAPGPPIGPHNATLGGQPPTAGPERGPNEHAGALPHLETPNVTPHPPIVGAPTGAAPNAPSGPHIAPPAEPGGRPPAETAHGQPNEPLTHAGALPHLETPTGPSHPSTAGTPPGAGTLAPGVAHGQGPRPEESHPAAPNREQVQVPTAPVHPTPPPQMHVQPPPPPQVHAAPPPQEHFQPPPQAHVQPPQAHVQPPPQVHVQPPPEVHVQPPPQAHFQPPPAPRPAPPPQVHAQAPPPPAPHPAEPPPAAHPNCPPGKHC